MLAAAAAAFLFGAVRLFILRFEAGDVYPAYSSLRTDPLGARAFYDALDNLGAAVSRNYKPFSGLEDVRDATFFCLGSNIGDISRTPEDAAEGLSGVAGGGARLVISFMPARTGPHRGRNRQEEKEEKEKEEEEGKQEESTHVQRGKFVSLSDGWGVDFDYKKSEENAVLCEQDLELPGTVSWHGDLFFKDLDDAWRVIYTVADRPVLIERDFGFGVIVLSADSYFLSNEAMRKERHPKLLAWLAGSSSSIVFDETHLGVFESSGTAALARRYGLHGLLASLILLAGLFVWKNSLSFVPPAGEDFKGEEGATLGKDSAAGFVNLLRRNIPSHRILSVCLGEWDKCFSHKGEKARELGDKARELIEEDSRRLGRDRDPVGTYRAVTRIVGVVQKGVTRKYSRDQH